MGQIRGFPLIALALTLFLLVSFSSAGDRYGGRTIQADQVTSPEIESFEAMVAVDVRGPRDTLIRIVTPRSGAQVVMTLITFDGIVEISDMPGTVGPAEPDLERNIVWTNKNNSPPGDYLGRWKTYEFWIEAGLLEREGIQAPNFFGAAVFQSDAPITIEKSIIDRRNWLAQAP